MSARSINKVLLIGNLTRDPNLRFTPNGRAVCSFAIATNYSWMPLDGGEKQDQVEYHSIVAWAKLAEICGQMLRKGDKVYVDGRLQTREWKGDDGVSRKTTEVVIDNMMLLSNSRAAAAANSTNPTTRSANAKEETMPSESGASIPTPPSDEDMSSGDEVSSVEDVADDIPF